MVQTGTFSDFADLEFTNENNNQESTMHKEETLGKEETVTPEPETITEDKKPLTMKHLEDRINDLEEKVNANDKYTVYSQIGIGAVIAMFGVYMSLNQ